MSIQRIGVLLRKEVKQGSTNLFFILSFVYPVVLTLLVTLVFGDLFAQRPRLGIMDMGNSQITQQMQAAAQLDTRIYTDEATLRSDVERGTVEIGLILPANFDTALQGDNAADISVFAWGEANVSNIIIIEAALQQAFVQVSSLETPISLNETQFGDANIASWSERLLPLLVLITVIVGGTLVPASSLVEEKNKRTLSGLTVTPTTLLEIYAAKALLGVAVSASMGVLVLVLNGAFGNQPALLVSLLLLSAVACSVFGVLLGSFVQDANTLLAIVKAIGIILFAPGLLELVPQIPAWVAQLFPTYYIMNPVLEVSQNGAGVGDIALDVGILLAITGGMMLILARIFEKQQEKLAHAG